MGKSFLKWQRVFTCLQVFWDGTLSALKVPDLENNDGNAKFISKLVEFWKTVDVYNPYADISSQDLNSAVIRTLNLQKLIHMSNSAKEIANKWGKRVRSLTKDTGNCLSNTCYGLVELSIHILGKTY